jgi:hypothetical protein
VADQISKEESKQKPPDPLSPAAAAAHRSGAAYSADLVSISRRVLYAQAVVIAMVAAIFFMAGYVLGPGRAEKKEERVERKERFGKTVDIPGTITFGNAAGSPTIDPGAVVILLPKGGALADRLASEGLRPADPMPADDMPTVAAIKYLGGAYLRADERGEIDLAVNSGRYYVLVISKGAARQAGRKITTQDAEEMRQVFADPDTLIGDRRYDWRLRKLGKDTLLNISLD